jgi:hypothetical protein
VIIGLSSLKSVICLHVHRKHQLVSYTKMLIIGFEVNTKRFKLESSCVFKKVVYIVTAVCLKSLRVIKRRMWPTWHVAVKRVADKKSPTKVGRQNISLCHARTQLNKQISRLVTIAYISSYACVFGVVVVVVVLLFYFFEYCFT